ncbi:trifunctional purine biosynthetic protein adenosine-3 [Cricetulus griseus]|uniref:Trifunctional purine biosynthetic protein adenosine-3 n=1 Tax=Cricetulus griseus TaxID=10029 RepID=A0A061I985_CRIGR|nr:trifunctional purine biosynthetic protein adenosine-3 [Cricetulus griseus]
MAARVLVIGSGGREHTLAWKLAQSHHVKQVLVAPGNAGTASSGKISNAAVSITDHTVLAQFCKDEKIEFVVVGPEAPLAAGVVEDLACAGVRCFGPTAQAAQLESSKKFAKEFMDRHGIPTAQWKAFTKPEDACSFIMSANFPALVVKASGLAAGKGVIVAKNKEEACKAVQEIMQEKSFGAAGETVVVEEFLDGEEVSCLCFTDGKTVAPMPPAQDHKRLLDGDQGPNTGGMGAYCPTPQVPTDLLLKIKNTILQRTVDGMRQEGAPYTGGETAEMPDMYPPGEYDLAGFAVGAMERDQKLPRLERITEGDVVVGVASSGLHSNGFSLVRKIVARSSLQYSSPAPGGHGDQTLGDLLLTPTRIYSHSLLPIIRSGRVKALAHITGGGLLENIPRVLPKKLGVDLDACTWRIPKVFSWLQQEGQLSEEEMARTFNCGVGAALVVSKDQTDQILHDIRQRQEEAWVIGSVVACPEDSPRVRVKNLMEAMQMNGAVVSNGFLRSHFPAQQKKSRVAVLISGTGSNLQALIDSTKDAKSSTHIVVVISNKAGVAGLDKAEKAGIPTRVINHKLYKSRVEFDNAVDQVLEEFSVDIVCLAGFMRILSGPFVRKWDGKMLNIHPSLLPSFKGSNAHEQVLEAGVTITGCTVHFVAVSISFPTLCL